MAQTTRVRRKRAARVVVATLAVALQSASIALAETRSGSCSEKPYVVMIHADWCGTCRALESTWKQIRAELADEATILQFDVTDRTAFEASRAEAARLGIGEFFDEYRGRTGTIAVLDCETRKPVSVGGGERDLSTYREAVARAAKPS